MASSIPSQARAIDPFASYNSDTVNVLTRMLTNGEDGISTALSCDVIDSTSTTEVILQPGFVYIDDVWINISAQHTVDFTDSNHYYNFDTGFDETGYYYVVLEYTYARSRPAPQSRALIIKPSQISAYTQGGSWLFLKAVKVEGVGPFHVASVHNYDLDNMDNKRIYVAKFAGTEVGLPTFNRERDQSRFVYGIEEDDFFFGFSDGWASLKATFGTSYPVDTVGFNEGDLVYTKSNGNLSLAVATLSVSTSDGVITKTDVDGLIQTVGKVEGVRVDSTSNVVVGTLVYLSKIEPGKISNTKSTPYHQFVGRCIGVIDSTSVAILYHRGEPEGTSGAESTILPSGASWIASGGLYYQEIDISSFGSNDVVIEIYDIDTSFKIEPTDIEFVSATTVKIWMPDDTHQLNVTIIG